jgi:hypothetical protein
MKESRLNRLAALTRGAAVIGIGLAGVACTKNGDESAPPQTINAPAPTTPVDTAAAAPTTTPPLPTGSPTTAASGSVPVRHFPIPNAMPGKMANPDGGDPIDRK